MTYREIVYMILDEMRLSSDDSFFTTDHVVFLLEKYRAFLLKQRYSDVRRNIPRENYQTVCLSLTEDKDSLSYGNCSGPYRLITTDKVPDIMEVGIPRITPVGDIFGGEINYVSPGRFKYAGWNKFNSRLIYATLGSDYFVHVKSSNPQILHLESISLSAVFTEPSKLTSLLCSNKDLQEPVCDILDTEFPIESSMVPPMTELVLKELLPAVYRPSDRDNNANDDLDGAGQSR